MTNPLVIHGPAMTGGRFLDEAWVHIVGGRIAAVERRPPAGGAEMLELAPGRLLAPGFVDIHVHGAGGVDASDGSDAIISMARTLALRGVTAFLPTSIAAQIDTLVAFAATVASLRRAQDKRRRAGGPSLQATLLGANLEGPALSPKRAGAHDPSLLLTPRALLDAWRSSPAGWREVRLTTVAPELDGGPDLVRHLARSGVAVSLGHSDASFEQATAAYEDGATSTTHLFNAMSGVSARQPGLAAAALSHGSAFVELIADGIHVDRALWPMLWRLLGPRLIAVSDGMAGAGAPDGEYQLGGRLVVVRAGRATLADGTIAGSVITVADAVANLRGAGMPLEGAVAAATTAPARLLRRRDVGRIARGARADLVILSEAGVVQRVMLGGAWLGG